MDEVRDHDADLLNEIVLPLMNVDRRTMNGKVNPNEPQQTQLYMTSAGGRGSFAYQKLVETLEQEIINPEDAFVWGCDYTVPQMHGLLNKKYLNEIKQSATYKDDTFAREYLGKWTGANSESWFDYDKMTKYRKIINPELSEKLRGNKEIFYLLSVDVGRYTCQTVVTVFKILPQESHFRIAVPNIVVLGLSEQEKHFERQAIALKKMIQSYNAKYVIIDGNGLIILAP